MGRNRVSRREIHFDRRATRSRVRHGDDGLAGWRVGEPARAPPSSRPGAGEACVRSGSAPFHARGTADGGHINTATSMGHFQVEVRLAWGLTRKRGLTVSSSCGSWWQRAAARAPTSLLTEICPIDRAGRITAQVPVQVPVNQMSYAVHRCRSKKPRHDTLAGVT